MPVTSASDAGDLADVAGTTSSRRSSSARLGRVVGAVAARSGSRRARPCWSGLISTSTGSPMWPLAQRAPLELARCAACDLRARVTSSACTDDDRRDLAARERGLHAVVGLHDRQVARQAVEPGWPCACRTPGSPARPAGGRGQRADSAGRSARGRGSRPRRATRRRPRARPRNGTRPFSTRSPSLDSIAGSTVSEPITATATTRIVPMPKRRERRVAGEEHAGHRDHHREAGDQHGAARGRRGGLERPRLAMRRRAAPRARGAGRTASSRRRRPGRSAARPS